MEKIKIDNKEFEAWSIPTEKANILLIKAKHGFLACGYFAIETANKLEENVAIVTGVKNFDDMLAAKVIKTSMEAEKKDIEIGMSGKDALMKMS